MRADHRGYVIGPILAADEPAWPIDWESNVDDDCLHDWELVLLASNGPNEKGRARVEECVRCTYCHVPRCGHSTDEDPCDRRRHHRGEHLSWSVVSRVPHIEEDPIAIRHGWTHWQKKQQERTRG